MAARTAVVLTRRASMTLLSTTKKRSCELSDEIARATAAMSAAASVALLSAAEQGAGELADQIA
jgi:hypothetical protein